MGIICENGCLTCKYGSISDKYYIDCNFPMPDPLPESIRYCRASICFEYRGEYQDPETARAYMCHDEYYDEGYVANCKCWEKRKRAIPFKQILSACPYPIPNVVEDSDE